MVFKSLRNLTYALSLATAAYFVPGTIKDINEIKQEYLFSAPFSALEFPYKKETIVLPIPELMSLYISCDQRIYTRRTFTYAKTPDEIKSGVTKRQRLEDLWRLHFQEKVAALRLQGHHIDTTQKWHNPIKGFSWFGNSFNDPRIREGRWREKHKAIDIFAEVGTQIYAPVSGVVIASADNWTGSWGRRKGLQYEEGGLGKLSGNGIVIFNPFDTSYHFLIHMKNVYALPGVIVSRGDTVGTIGVTGNAISPNVPKHLHFAYKKPGKECGIEDVLVSQNPYWDLKETMSMQLAQKN